MRTIWWDMDGTIANLYAVENWLADLRAESVRPYAEALPMLNFSLFARLLNRLQAEGWKVGIISWTAKNGSEAYNLAVESCLTMKKVTATPGVRVLTNRKILWKF